MATSMANGSHRQSLLDKFDLSLEKLEPKYINQCDNVKELERILRVLRSGEEGTFLHLEELCEYKINLLFPKSRVLRKETPLISTRELPDKDNIVDDIKSWTNEMKSKDTLLGRSDGGGDENLPPIRSGSHLIGTAQKPSQSEQAKKNKNPMPRNYREWDKIISNLDDNEVEQTDTNAADTSDQLKKPSRSLTNQINTDGMSTDEKTTLANREKDKGNEAFRSGDFMEAVVYYNRSLSVLPTAATYNNRALAYIRVSKWSDAVSDCNRVLSEEPDNIKATLRRACAYKSLRRFRLAKEDLDTVLDVEPQNKRAQDILKDVSKELAKQEQMKAEGRGNRMVIEETDGESDDEDGTEEIEIKPSVQPTMSATPDHSPPQQTHTDLSREPVPATTSQPRRIIIEEDSESSDDNSDEFKSADSKSASSSSRAGSPSGSDSSNSTSPRGKKTPARNNSLLSIIQQKMATPPSKDVPGAHAGSGDSPGDVNAPTADTDNATAESSSTSTAPANNGDAMDLSAPDAETRYASKAPAGDGHSDTSEQVVSSDTKAPAGDGCRDASAQAVSSDTTEQVATSEPKTAAGQCTEDNDSMQAQGEGTTTPVPTGDTAEELPVQDKVIRVPALPTKANSLKTKGNELFKAGQYGEAVNYYTQAIDSLSGDASLSYHQAMIYSNRSACYLKTGDCRAAINDCTTALQLAPNNAKALLRRATAYETLERYLDAYVDYRHVVNIDSNASSAHTGANRCEKMLSDEQGRKWRTKVPKIPSCSDLTKYEVEGAAAGVEGAAAGVVVKEEEKPEAAPIISPPKAESLEDQFERVKGLGNKCVAEADFEQARMHYSAAIKLCPARVAPYSNRSLCHLRCGDPQLAIEDCDTVLAIEPTHIKAMFRRAQANKMLEKYKESLADLMSLLKLDPTNAAAKKESEIVKPAYRKQLQSLKTTSAATSTPGSKQSSTKANKQSPAQSSCQHNAQAGKSHQANQAPAQPAKPSTRIVIEEGSDSDTERSPATQAPAEPPAQTHSKSKSRQKKKKQAKKSASSQSPQPSSNIVPTLSPNPTPYEFTQAWAAMRQIKETEPYAQLLRQIPPTNLATVVSNKLEAEMLEKIILCLDKHFSTDELGNVESYLKSLASVPRFSMITMFMSPSCKSALESLFKKLQTVSSHVDKFRIAYGL